MVKPISPCFLKSIFDFIFEMGVEIFCGLDGRWIDITKQAYIHCYDTNKRQLFIPRADARRQSCFGDIRPEFLKSIKILIGETETLYNTNDEILIENFTFDSDLLGKIETSGRSQLTLAIDKLHSNLQLLHGSLLEEYPEQLMSYMFIKPYSVVLEIGGNVGRNSCFIASLLEQQSNLVVLESNPEYVVSLQENRKINGLTFAIEDSALSARRLCQNGWNTIPIENDQIPAHWFEVKTIDWNSLQNKYKLTFDTLVADCEGALYYILQDFPCFLENIKTILVENDYRLGTHKTFVLNIFVTQGFKLVHQAPYLNRPDFFQSWTRT